MENWKKFLKEAGTVTVTDEENENQKRLGNLRKLGGVPEMARQAKQNVAKDSGAAGPKFTTGDKGPRFDPNEWDFAATAANIDWHDLNLLKSIRCFDGNGSRLSPIPDPCPDPRLGPIPGTPKRCHNFCTFTHPVTRKRISIIPFWLGDKIEDGLQLDSTLVRFGPQGLKINEHISEDAKTRLKVHVKKNEN